MDFILLGKASYSGDTNCHCCAGKLERQSKTLAVTEIVRHCPFREHKPKIRANQHQEMILLPCVMEPASEAQDRTSFVVPGTSSTIFRHLLHPGFLTEIISSSETSFHVRTTGRYIPEDGRQNLKFYIKFMFWNKFKFKISSFLLSCLDFSFMSRCF